VSTSVPVAVVLGLSGYGLQVLGLGLAPLTVVQPVLALGLVLLLFLGVRLLGEDVGPRELAGVAAIVVGVTVIAVAAPARESDPALGAPLVGALIGLGLLTAIPFCWPGAGGRAASCWPWPRARPAPWPRWPLA
jgi:multidrug transporter EmrE-like cation transporter